MALLLGCAAEPPSPSVVRLSHDRDLQPLWDDKCAD